MIYGLKGVWESMVAYVQHYNCLFECDLWCEWPLIREGHNVISLKCVTKISIKTVGKVHRKNV